MKKSLIYLSILMVVLISVGVVDNASAKRNLKLTPLHNAAFYNDVNSIKNLLEQGAEINVKAARDVTPLHMAAHEGNKEAVILLLAKGADPDIVNEKEETPLDVAVRKGHADVADILFKATKTDSNNLGYTPVPKNAGK